VQCNQRLRRTWAQGLEVKARDCETIPGLWKHIEESTKQINELKAAQEGLHVPPPPLFFLSIYLVSASCSAVCRAFSRLKYVLTCCREALLPNFKRTPMTTMEKGSKSE